MNQFSFFYNLHEIHTSFVGNELICAFKSSGILSGKFGGDEASFELYGSGTQLKIYLIEEKQKFQ